MLGFTPLDLGFIAGYIAAIAAIGAWTRLRSRTQEEYFLGGRRFGKLVQVFASFGQAATPDGPVAVATTTFHNGAAGVWSSLLMVFCTPLYWITSPWLRRLRVLTMGDFYVERYGSKAMAAAYAVIATIGMMNVLSAGYVATAKTAVAMAPKPIASWSPAERGESALAAELGRLEQTDARTLSVPESRRMQELRDASPHATFSYLTPQAVIWTACAVTVLNAVMGGLAAAFYATLLQGVLVIGLSAMLIPFGLARIQATWGGHGPMEALATLHARLPKDFFQIFGSNQLPDFTWYYVLAVSVVAGVTVITQPNQLVTNAAARDEMSARVGMVAGSFIKRLCTILWAGCGLICSLVYAGSIRDSDLVWGHASRDLLGGAGLGLVGLMLAAMLSALMAVSNSVMLTISGLVTANLYKPLRPGRTDSHYIAVGRIAGVTFLAGSALIATQFDSLLVILKLNWEYFAIFSAAFWLGLKWRRANRAGAWASILFSFLALYAVPVALTAVFPTIRSSPALALQTRPGMVAHSYLTALERRPQHETYIPAESIFWSQGLKPDVSGRLSGQGYPFLDLALLQAVGFDLQSHSKAFNETMRIVLRLLLPFVILALVSPAAPRDDARMLDRFYSKMRTRVDGRGHDSDVAKVESTMADPQRLRSLLLFPNSDWEIYRWNRADTIGILASIAFVFVVLGLLVGALSLGS